VCIGDAELCPAKCGVDREANRAKKGDRKWNGIRLTGFDRGEKVKE
jgi:hypothetical protein